MAHITAAQYQASLPARVRRRHGGIAAPPVGPRYSSNARRRGYGVGASPAPGLTPAKVEYMVQQRGVPVTRFSGRARIWAERAAAGLPAATFEATPSRARRRRRRRRSSIIGALASALLGGRRRRRRRRLTPRRPSAGPTIECAPDEQVAVDAFGNLYCRTRKVRSL